MADDTCMLTALDSLDVYSRPDNDASLWGILPPGGCITISGVTADGWLGFDPGVAQAGNSGSFRYRWIAPGGSFTLTGDHDRIETVWGPAAGITYAMTFTTTPIYVEPDTSSFIADSLPGDSAACILSRMDGWYHISTSESPTPDVLSGWVNSMDVSVSGELDTIPELGEPVLPD